MICYNSFMTLNAKYILQELILGYNYLNIYHSRLLLIWTWFKHVKPLTCLLNFKYSKISNLQTVSAFFMLICHRYFLNDRFDSADDSKLISKCTSITMTIKGQNNLYTIQQPSICFLLKQIKHEHFIANVI